MSKGRHLQCKLLARLCVAKASYVLPSCPWWEPADDQIAWLALPLFLWGRQLTCKSSSSCPAPPATQQETHVCLGRAGVLAKFSFSQGWGVWSSSKRCPRKGVAVHSCSTDPPGTASTHCAWKVAMCWQPALAKSSWSAAGWCKCKGRFLLTQKPSRHLFCNVMLDSLCYPRLQNYAKP